jgi:hypothetical protein
MRCKKPFATRQGAVQHSIDKHGEELEPVRRKKPPREEREPSLADISVEAHLKRAMGEPLDALEESLIFD